MCAALAIVIAAVLLRAQPTWGAASSVTPGGAANSATAARDRPLEDGTATTAAARLARVRIDLASASTHAALAMERSNAAREADAAAQVRLAAARRDLAQAGEVLQASQVRLGGWARRAYQSGSPMLTDGTMMSLLTAEEPGDVVESMVALGKVGHAKSVEVDLFEAAKAERDAAARAAAEQAKAAARAAAAAREAHTEARLAVREQEKRLRSAEAALEALIADAAASGADISFLRDMVEALVANPDLINEIGKTGACTGGPLGGYANGRLPRAALCPVYAAPGHLLRADAAFGFERMSRAYAARFGSPICVTDSYRDYAGQVSAHERKPTMTAVPGTSNHGWARAVDLCGGVESFGTGPHAWLKVNAPLYGWYHPTWAEPNGSRPEPWHWEFGG